MDVFRFREGSTPLLVSMPHCGTWLPDGLMSDINPAALDLADTDWHLPELYQCAAESGAGQIQAVASRYLIDLNRPPDDGELYPGSNGTGLCPTRTFRGDPLYRSATVPDSEDIAKRLETFWQPYHAKLQLELGRLKQRFGVAILLEAHSICGHIPNLFDGDLPDLNLGTVSGSSCSPELRSRVETLFAGQSNYTVAVDQRFKGGYITRAYGLPGEGIHALQLELSQRTYMEEAPPFAYLPERAVQLQPLLQRLVQLLIDWGEAG